MSASDVVAENGIVVAPSSPATRNSELLRSRKFLLLAVVLVVVVIAVSTVATSGVSKSIVAAQHHYLSDVTPVEEADVIFNGGASTAPDHSKASTRTLELALGKEFNELDREKWPNVAAVDVAHLATYTRAEYRLLLRFDSATSAGQSAILAKQSTLLNKVESTNLSILKELKLPIPTTQGQPIAPPMKVP
jgi:hypothetical protein